MNIFPYYDFYTDQFLRHFFQTRMPLIKQTISSMLLRMPGQKRLWTFHSALITVFPTFMGHTIKHYTI